MYFIHLLLPFTSRELVPTYIHNQEQHGNHYKEIIQTKVNVRLLATIPVHCISKSIVKKETVISSKNRAPPRYVNTISENKVSPTHFPIISAVINSPGN